MKLLGMTIAAAAAIIAAQPAHADILNSTFAVTVSEGATGGNGINSTSGNPFSGTNTASATFTYSGPLNFSNTSTYVQSPPGTLGDINSAFGFSTSNISGYSGSGTVTVQGTQVANFGTLSAFLGSSGSGGQLQYASYYTFDLGNVAAGTVLTITHDDGAAIYQGSTRIGSTVTGPTGAVTDTVVIPASGADTILRYTRQNSTPSILQVAVPEPMSLALLGAGLAGLGLVRRKKQAA